MTDRSRTKLSKVMSLILRHEAAKFGLAPDDHGWIDIAPFLDAIRDGFPDFRDITADDLLEVVDDPENPRHEIRTNRIRAVYGHSAHVAVDYRALLPPAVLYRGTSMGGLEAILAEGLRPMARGYVHLSEDRERAQRVGRRKGKEVTVLVVDAARASGDGVIFHNPVSGIWLARHIPATYLSKES